MVSCKHDIARISQLISFNSSSFPWWCPVFGGHVCQSLTLDLREVHNVRLLLKCECFHVFLVAPSFEPYFVVPRSLGSVHRIP